MNQPPIEDIRRQNAFIIVSAVMIVVALLFVILRCVSRFILIRTPGPDDYFIIAAMTLTLGYLVNVILAAQNGIGLPMSTLTLQNMVNFLKIALAIEVMYYVNVFCIKVSILFTYLRFAVTRTFRNLCIGTIVLHVVFVLVCIFTTLAQCQPIHKFWDITGQVKGTCINTTAFFYFTSSFNIVTDIWILLLPISTLREIHRPPREKVALFLIFGVGTFATIASIVRLHTIYTYTLATDPFHEGTKVNLWSVIEVTIAISCASVSALKPMFSRRQRRLTLGAIGGRSGGHGYRAYGTGTFTGTNNTGTGSGAGSRSTGVWALSKNKGGGNNGLGTQSSEIGLHDDMEDMEDIELRRLGSHAETLVDDQVKAATPKEGEKEFNRHWSQHSSSAHSRQQQQQHARQQSTSSGAFISPASPKGQTTASSLSPIQRPKPAAIPINNQTRPFSFPPPLSPNQIAGHMGLKYPGHQRHASQQQQQQQQQQQYGGGARASVRGRERGMSETASTTTSTSRQMTMMGGVQSQGQSQGQGQGQGADGGTWAGLSGLQQGEVVSTGTGPRDGTSTSKVTRPPIGPRASTFGE
ncbi:hypothetical protein QR685DRAFT_114010 [Neurospora intermedia]|uniref:Rhodopsin domain-containing protein n=1 Tax=Neurospora intermedia TaxID=5142 RepID=A0ABR3D0Y4_NEUIN